MEFTIACPIDGSVEVSLEDIDNVVLRESDRADITFVCPHCGSEITVTAVVPSFLLAAIEALADDTDTTRAGTVSFAVDDAVEDAQADDPQVLGDVVHDAPSFDAYCEYFRRQLEQVDTVEAALREIDALG